MSGVYCTDIYISPSAEKLSVDKSKTDYMFFADGSDGIGIGWYNVFALHSVTCPGSSVDRAAAS